jgi:hypothetical protein
MPINAKEFLDTIFDNLNDDEFVCVSRAIEKKDGTGVWFRSFKRDARQFRRWNPAEQAQAWYFCVSTVDGESNDKGTMVARARKNLKRYHCIVLDDIGTKVTPPPVEPSWKVTTSVVDGKPSQQWGYCLDPGDDWGLYEAVVEWCAGQGWSDAGAGGAYRLMRVPGSANLKPGRQAYRTHVTESEWPVWSLVEFMEDMGCEAEALDVRDVAVATKTGGALAMDGIDPMLEWLGDNGHVVRDGGGEWVDIVCPWADTHTTGSNTAGYSPLGRGSGKYVQTRAFNCLHEHCVDRKLAKFREWASKLGAPSVSGYDPLPWLQAKYTYVETGQMVMDLHQRPKGGVWEWSLADWSKRYLKKIYTPGRDQPVLVSTAFLEHDSTKHAVDLMYQPVAKTADTGVITKLGQDYVNMYVPPNHEPTDEVPRVFLDHVDYLLPDPWHREIFLNWLAKKIQSPASRSFCVVMVAEDTQGTGRSWLKDMLLKVLQRGINSASMAQMYGMGTSSEQNYTKWKSECQYIVVEESRDNTMSRDDYYHGYITFKRNCDTKPSEAEDINVKYGRISQETLYYNVLIFSNHADAMVIPEEDRRITVLDNPTARADYKYYERLHGSLQTQEPRRVFWFLMRRELVSHYDEWGAKLAAPVPFDHIYPPETPTRRRMIEDTRAPSEMIIGWLRDHHAPDLVTRAALKAAIVVAARDLDDEKTMREPGNITRILWRKLKSLRPGDAKNGARYMIDGKQTEVRSIRRGEFWVDQDEARDGKIINMELGKTERAENIVEIRATRAG